MKSLLTLLTLVLLGTAAVYADEPTSLPLPTDLEPVYVGEPSEQPVSNVRIEGDVLYADAGYGGGCGEHHLWATWDGAVDLSEPAGINLTINAIHDDPCEAFITRTHGFDLSTIRTYWQRNYTDSATIQISVGGSTVNYTF